MRKSWNFREDDRYEFLGVQLSPVWLLQVQGLQRVLCEQVCLLSSQGCLHTSKLCLQQPMSAWLLPPVVPGMYMSTAQPQGCLRISKFHLI